MESVSGKQKADAQRPPFTLIPNGKTGFYFSNARAMIKR